MGMVIGIDVNDVLRDYTGQFEYAFNKYMDESFRLGDDEPSTFDFSVAFPFVTQKDYENFRYTDYPFELNGRADPVSQTVHANLNRWINTDLDDTDERPEVIIFSALESQLTIQATLAYLSWNMCRVRELAFPVDSSKMWERCDVIVTANPNILASKPDGKKSVKIEAPYNKDSEADFTFKDLESMMSDENKSVLNIFNHDEEK